MAKGRDIDWNNGEVAFGLRGDVVNIESDGDDFARKQASNFWCCLGRARTQKRFDIARAYSVLSRLLKHHLVRFAILVQVFLVPLPKYLDGKN